MDPEGAARSRRRAFAGWHAASLGRDLIGLSTDEVRIVHEFATKSAATSSTAFRRATSPRPCSAFDGVVGNFASPYTPGTAYVLLHHLFGEAAGVPGAWGHAIGGMGAITQAMAKACREAGVDIVLGTPVERSDRRERAARSASSPAARAWRAARSPVAGQSQAAVRPAGAQGRGRATRSSSTWPLGLRKRDLPDERRARQAAQFHRRCRGAATI
jgi:phytoene dehydrogenase-like protein